MEQAGRFMMLVGLGLALLGGIVFAIGRLFPSFRPGHLPGDISVEKPGFTLAIPLTTMILVSIVASLLLWLLGALRR
ncbi:MAG: DUF2905 domain-containing protein [Armatimonadetes bacterium]|nr:DUF2905 domain-containing protein [Armatimonadota bacterium]